MITARIFHQMAWIRHQRQHVGTKKKFNRLSGEPRRFWKKTCLYHNWWVLLLKYLVEYEIIMLDRLFQKVSKSKIRTSCCMTSDSAVVPLKNFLHLKRWNIGPKKSSNSSNETLNGSHPLPTPTPMPTMDLQLKPLSWRAIRIESYVRL